MTNIINPTNFWSGTWPTLDRGGCELRVVNARRRGDLDMYLSYNIECGDGVLDIGSIIL